MTKEQQIEEMAQEILHAGVALDGVDFVHGLFDKDDHFRRLARKLYAAGYRKADEVRKDTAREILQRLWKWKSSIIFDTESVLVAEAQFEKAILALAKEDYGVEVKG